MKYDLRQICMASVFIGTKLEDVNRKVRDIITVFHHVFQVNFFPTLKFSTFSKKLKDNQSQISLLDPSSKLFAKMRLSVIEIEKIILKELGFELYRIGDHPHKLMHHYLKLLKANNEVARKAWSYLNDTYRLPLCVHYPASTLAASCLYLSLRSLSIPMPAKPWWVLMETSLSQIHDICAEVLNLYSQPDICLKDIREILKDTSVSLNLPLD